jgi:general secretion pathway protein G
MKKTRQSGFTLIEILVTTAIIGILIGIVFGISGLASKKSDTSKALADMQKIRNALEEYRLQFGGYPVFTGNLTDSGFNTYYVRITEQMENKMPNLRITDPWGRGYVYSNQSAYAFSLSSQGAKTTDASDDIDSANSNF